MKLLSPYRQKLRQHFPGLLTVAALSTITLATAKVYGSLGGFPLNAVAAPTAAIASPIASSSADSMVRLSGLLSQTKLVQSDEGTVYLNLAVEGPAEIGQTQERAAVDVVVVLDRSGSMAEDQKLPFAKAAIQELINRLQSEDRFALVTFDDSARTDVVLTPVTAGMKETLHGVVTRIQTGGGTNIGDGLNKAKQLLLESRDRSELRRARKIVLLSDGQTNVGITDPKVLNGMAKAISDGQATVSTVGMGLGFNESLMASLSDYGMGSYAFLERLDGLDKLFAKDLNDTRSIYAQGSYLDVKLPAGVELIDAGGYPIETINSDPSMRRVRAGQILRGSKKQIALTYRVATSAVGSQILGSVQLNYQADGKEEQLALASEALTLAVVPVAERAEAVASINQDLLRSTWSKNNLGIMQKRVQKWIEQGNDSAAKDEIAEYRAKARAEGGKAGTELLDQSAERELQSMEDGLNDAVSAKGAVRDEKLNRYRKQAQSSGYANQLAGW